MRAAAEAGEGKAKAVKPIVIDDYQFKQDKEGYLTAASRTHLYLLDTRSGASEALTRIRSARTRTRRFPPTGASSPTSATSAAAPPRRPAMTCA